MIPKFRHSANQKIHQHHAINQKIFVYQYFQIILDKIFVARFSFLIVNVINGKLPFIFFHFNLIITLRESSSKQHVSTFTINIVINILLIYHLTRSKPSISDSTDVSANAGLRDTPSSRTFRTIIMIAHIGAKRNIAFLSRLR